MILISINDSACSALTPELADALSAVGEDVSRLNRLEWPAGASKHAEGTFLLHSDEAARLTSADLSKPVAVTMFDDTLGPVGAVIADTMYQIEHRPIVIRVGTDGKATATLYAVTLVDERYFWKWKLVTKGYNMTLPWDRSSYYTQSKSSGTAWTWETMLRDILGLVGQTTDTVEVDVDTSAAGDPVDYLFNGESAAEAIDRICAAMGAVFVANLNAANGSKRYIIDQAVNFNSNVEKHNDKFLSERTAGGVIYTYGGPVLWINVVMPESVKVYFPRALPANTVDSQSSSNPPILNRFYSVTSTAGKPPKRTGRAGFTVSIYDTTWAMGSIGSETNASALSSRADFLAGAYYQRFWLDHSAARMRGFENVGAFPGIIVWQLGVDGPFTDVYSNGTWPYYGGDRDVLTGMRPPRVVGVGDVQTWEAFDGSVMVGNLPSNEAVRVKITGNATGGGKYTGRTISAATSDVSNSSDLAEGDLGTVASADNCLILNTGEIGESTHDLTDSDSDDGNLYHVGAIIRTNSDGTVVVQINDRGECTS